MRCVSCNIVLDDDMLSYNISHIGLELTVALEGILNHEVDQEGLLCGNCFNNTVRRLSQKPMCPSASRCVWCLQSIIGCHTHSLPDCPEKYYIAQRILPRQIQPGYRVCYACWLAARRNVQRQDRQGTSSATQERDSIPADITENQPALSSEMSNCVCCEISIVGRHSHSLPQGLERDEIATRIFPRQIEPNSRVCYACWMAARRSTRNGTAQPDSLQKEAPTRLPNYRRAGNSSNACFVRGCTNPERLVIPKILKLQLLKMHKLYLPMNARICREHLCVYDWGFLEEQHYVHNFSVFEIEDIINLALDN